uniref:SSD domain-containing protein n=1 Tax=Romanomermis culicivorax TaxID=13658 RepID=A0A915J551_ROMCU
MEEQRSSGYWTKTCDFLESIIDSYCSVIVNYPVWVMIVTGVVSAGLSIAGFLYGTLPEFSDPKIGFETRNTEWSPRVVTWQILEQQLSLHPRSGRNYFRQLDKLNRRRRDQPFDDHILSSLLSDGVFSGPCLQLGYPFKEAQYFAHVVLESSNTQNLFTVETMKEMCRFQDQLNSTFDPLRPYIKYPHFWSLPNYLTCLSDRNHCDQLTEADLDDRVKNLAVCQSYVDQIFRCYDPEIQTEDETCQENLPQICRSKFYRDLFFFILSKNSNFVKNFNSTGPIYLNLVLPVMQLTSYEYQNIKGANFEKMRKILDGIRIKSSELKNLRLKGLNLGIKLNLYGETLIQDSKFVLIAAILATTICIFYSGSLFYSTSVGLSLLYSVGLAYFFYSTVFRIDFFPFINLLVVVLLVGIGADNTFVLKHIFDDALSSTTRIECPDNHDPRKYANLRRAIARASKSMFITNATTAAAFYANYVSDVIVMKCFALFAGTTMICNYFLIITYLPASLVVLDKYIEPKMKYLNNYKIKVSKLGIYFARKILYRIVDRFKLLWLLIFPILFLFSTIVVFHEPGLGLPTKNPILLFKRSNPMEWYDDHKEDYFFFADSFQSNRIYLEIFWGFDAKDNYIPLLNPEILRPKNINLTLDSKFNLSLEKLQILGDFYTNLQNSSRISPSKAHTFSFYKQFIEWSKRQTCVRKSDICCNYTHPYFQESKFLNACLVQGSRVMDVWGDGPIFDSRSVGEYVPGYYMTSRTIYNSSLLYVDMKIFFDEINQEISELWRKANNGGKVDFQFWWVTYDYYTTLWYDLQHSLLYGTPVSIVVSIFVALSVAILATRTFLLSLLSVVTICGVIITTVACLVLFGWKLNIVESTIIILTAGLSFDFTLLYAAAYKITTAVSGDDDLENAQRDRVSRTLDLMSLPVLLSCLTTVSAGFCMLPSETMAYIEIGLFMIIIT